MKTHEADLKVAKEEYDAAVNAATAINDSEMAAIRAKHAEGLTTEDESNAAFQASANKFMEIEGRAHRKYSRIAYEADATKKGLRDEVLPLR